MTNFVKKILSKVSPEVRDIAKNIFYRARRFFHPPKKPKNDDGEILVHLGCGWSNNEKFINIDATPLPHVHYVRDIRNLSVLPNDYADLLYSSHALEHISHIELPKTLNEWARVIKKGGRIRLAVPDFDIILKMYNDSHNDINAIKDPLMGGQDYMYNFHKSIFNIEYLSKLLTQAGFSNIKVWDAHIDNYGFNDFAKKFKGSLNLEAEKNS